MCWITMPAMINAIKELRERALCLDDCSLPYGHLGDCRPG